MASIAFNPRPLQRRRTPSAARQAWTSLKRRWVLDVCRAKRQLLLDQLLVLLGSAFLGGAFAGEPAAGNLDSCVRLHVFGGLTIMLTTLVPSLRVFGLEHDKSILRREASAGTSVAAFYAAGNLSQLPLLLLLPALYLAVVFTLVDTRAPYRVHFAAAALLGWAASGVGYVLSLCLGSKAAQMAAVTIGLVATMVAGAMPTLPELAAHPWGGPASAASPIRWFCEAMFEAEALAQPLTLRLFVATEHVAQHQGYTLDGRFELCMAVLAGFGAGARLLAAVLIRLRNSR